VENPILVTRHPLRPALPVCCGGDRKSLGAGPVHLEGEAEVFSVTVFRRSGDPAIHRSTDPGHRISVAAMTRPSTAFLMLGGAILAGWAGYSALRRRVLNRAQVLALIALELLLFVQAVASVVTLLAGHDAAETSTHVVYLAGSLLVLPLLVGVPVRLGFPAGPAAPGSDPEFIGGIEIRPTGDAGSVDRFRPVVAALACLAIVVMLQRMWVTWRTGGAG
jgi:hypothetical protein